MKRAISPDSDTDNNNTFVEGVEKKKKSRLLTSKEEEDIEEKIVFNKSASERSKLTITSAVSEQIQNLRKKLLVDNKEAAKKIASKFALEIKNKTVDNMKDNDDLSAEEDDVSSILSTISSDNPSLTDTKNDNSNDTPMADIKVEMIDNNQEHDSGLSSECNSEEEGEKLTKSEQEETDEQLDWIVEKEEFWFQLEQQEQEEEGCFYCGCSASDDNETVEIEIDERSSSPVNNNSQHTAESRGSSINNESRDIEMTNDDSSDSEDTQYHDETENSDAESSSSSNNHDSDDNSDMSDNDSLPRMPYGTSNNNTTSDEDDDDLPYCVHCGERHPFF